jgi:hypothetical protein
MAYTMNWTDATLKDAFSISPNVQDTTSTSLNLVGKGFRNWGESVLENMLHMLENFASSTPPSHPTVGQIWYDSTNKLVKVYYDAAWNDVTNTTYVTTYVTNAVGVVQDQVDTLNTNVGTLGDQVTTISTDLTTANSQITEISGAITQIVDKNAAQDVVAANIQGQVDTLGALLGGGGSAGGGASSAVFDFSTPGNYNVYTMPYDGTVRFTLLGAGGGGAGGGKQLTGNGGAPGALLTQVVIENVPQGTVITATVGAGGVGGATTTTPLSPAAGTNGAASTITVGGTTYTAAGGVGGTALDVHSGSLMNASTVYYHCNDYGDFGSGYISGGTASAYAGSRGGAPGAGAVAVTFSGFGSNYGRHISVQGAAGNPAVLNGGNGTLGGGGGGGAPSAIYVSNRGFYQDPVDGDGGDGNPTTAGGAGGDGYLHVEIFNPNAVVTRAEWDGLITNGIVMDDWVLVYTGTSSDTSGQIDLLSSYGVGLYAADYRNITGDTPLGVFPTGSVYGDGSNLSQAIVASPVGSLIPKSDNAYTGSPASFYLKYLYKAKWKVNI